MPELRVILIGGSSHDKSTLAEALASKLGFCCSIHNQWRISDCSIEGSRKHAQN